MRFLSIGLLSLFLSSCTTTTITKYGPDGKTLFEASNTSLAWDRQDINLELLKAQGDTAVKIVIGKSGGSEGFKAAIDKMEEALAVMKAAAK